MNCGKIEISNNEDFLGVIFLCVSGSMLRNYLYICASNEMGSVTTFIELYINYLYNKLKHKHL